MINDSLSNVTKYKRGDVAEGEVVKTNDSFIFISLGGKLDAVAEIGDYMDENGNLTVKVGDKIKGYIVKISDDETVISKSLNRQHGNKKLIKDAFEKEIPVEGKVTEHVKGGFSIEVFGVRAFCPVSQMDIKPITDPKAYIGNVYNFKILENENRNIVLSRRAIMDKESGEKNPT